MDNISLGLLVAYLTASYSVLATGDNCLGNDTYIFIGNDTKIEKSVLTGDTKSSWKTLIKANSRPLGFDVDITTCTFFYSTGSKRHKGKIFAVNLINGSAGKIHRNLGYPLQVAVNWITQKLYWCDSTLSTIEYSDFDGDNRETLLENISIEAIALDPCANDIYWISKEDEDNYVISKMKLDGTNRHVIVSSNLEAPNSLVIDFISSKLYWTDKFKIQTSDLEGADRSTIYTTKVRRPTGISFYDNILYWAEWKNKIVSTCTTNGTDVRILVDNVNRSAAIHVMDRSRCLNGGWGSWTSWSSCSVTCGDSQKTRRRFCDNPPPSGGGSNCSGNSSQQQTCDTKDCPVDGQWGPFSRWSTCSQTCGGGTRTKQRVCNNPPPSNDGADCVGRGTRQRRCNMNACPVISGWGSWTSWSSCSATCGGGQRTRQRVCMTSGGGADCHGTIEHKVICNKISCPVNGGWGSWTTWSSCSMTCGSGQRTTQRFCDNPPPSGGGSDCSGVSRLEQPCYTSCPVNGGWGSWSSWSSCSATYGDSQKTRQRFCDNPPPSGGGSNCIGSSSQQKNCNITVNGQWGPFGSWSTCSQTCGGGIHTRQRSCDSPPPSNGGADCVGNATHQRNCDVNVCPVVNGGWSSWTNWSSCVEVCTALPSCSKICSHQRVRERFCNNPTPSGGGKNCSGNYSQQQACDAANSPEKPQFKDDFFRPSGGHHSDQVQAICHFDSNGVAGNVHLLQRRINSGKTRVNIMLDGLDELPGSDEYGLCVTEYPGDLNTANPCALAIVGDVYNPEGIDMSVSDYPDRCQADHGDCAIGDLATRHSPLTGNDTNTLVGLKDFNLNLFGPNTVVGRGMSLKRLDTDETLACCNIEMPTNTRVLRAPFNNGVFSGDITITLPRYDYLDYTKNENGIIMVDLERIDGGVANIPMLQWNLRRGIADSTCSNLEPPLGHQIAMGRDPSETCSQTQHRTCRLGDLTNKCGPLQLINNRIRTQCTDNQLGMVSFSIFDRLAISIDQGITILDYAQLNEVMPAGAYVSFNFDRRRVAVNLAFSQLTPQDPTMYRTYVTGLDGQAGNIVVFDGEDCDNLGSVLNYPGELPTSLPVTGDQYPVGELGPKMGGVLGRDYLRTQGLSSNIPLTGPVNITGKPITVLFQNGSVWGCGMVEDYYNMPYTPPEDVIDYLDLFVTPAP